jgi:hypothetical protein
MESPNSYRNVILFLSSECANQLYSERIQKYLQPKRVHWNFHTDTVEAFEEITKDSTAEWHLLITDTSRATTAASAIDGFKANHPACVVAVLGEKNEASTPSVNTVFVNSPAELDDWIAMMHSLLRQT